jgi:CheY-like chemotaxis protein
MPAFAEKDFLKELLYCLEKSDLVKAKALLQYTSFTSPPAQLLVVTKISHTRSEIAYPLMELLFEMENLERPVRDKLYEIMVSRLYNTPEKILENIRSNDKKNKSVYIQLAGDLKCQDALPDIEEVLQNDTEKVNLIAALKSAGAFRSTTSIPAVEKHVGASDQELRRSAIHALGEIDSVKAVKLLTRTMGKRDDDTDLLIVEALAALKTGEAMDALCTMLGSSHTDLRNAALSSLIDLGERAVPVILSHMTTDNEDLLIHLITTLGHIGDVSALPEIHKTLSKRSGNPNIRFAAFEAMGRLPSSKSAMNLAKGLEDPVEQVRVAAARAINTNLSSVLVGGLKNIVASKDDQASHVVAALIDAGADSAFGALMESDTFQELATDYIATKAHPETRAHFLSILQSRKESGLISKIEKMAPSPKAGAKQLIYVVDDSKMMLKVYLKKLHEFGYEPVTFEFPAEALKTLQTNKPDLIITDLNMPVINGLRLSKTVRSRYSAKELPILLITTQSDFIGKNSTGEEAKINQGDLANAGVNSVLHKPFTDDELSAAIKNLMPPK